MTKGICSRCGKKGEVEYGIDGLPYCENCSFYGFYRQCAKCKMYLPAYEFQQYKGMWLCPNCLADERQEEAKFKPKKEKLTTSVLSYQNTCERCGREAEVFYIFNGRRLCAFCLQEEQEKATLAGRKPFSPPVKVVVRKEKSFFQKIIDAILSFFGFRKKEAEIVALKNNKAVKEPLVEKKSRKKIEAEVLSEKAAGENREKFGKFKKD